MIRLHSKNIHIRFPKQASMLGSTNTAKQTFGRAVSFQGVYTRYSKGLSNIHKLFLPN